MGRIVFSTGGVERAAINPDGTGTGLLGGSQPVELRLRHLYNKLYNMASASGVPYPHVKYVQFGDSFTGLIGKWILPLMYNAWGGQAGAYLSASGLITTNASSGTIADNTTDFDAWPTGLTTGFATGASRTYGIGGSTFTCDTIKVYYVKGPSSTVDGGTFKVQIDGVDAQTGISTLAGSIGLGVVSLTPSLGLHNVTVVATTGPVRIVGVGMENSAVRGVVPIYIGQGGIALNSPTAAAWANLQTFLADVLPDLFTVEAKEDPSYWPAALVSLFSACSAGNPNMDVVGIQSSPVGPPQSDASQVEQNAQLRAACAAYNFVCWDGYTPLVNWDTVNELGWGTDVVHLTDQAHKFRAAAMIRDLGIFSLLDADQPFDTTAAQVTATTGVYIGKTVSNLMAQILADQTFDEDLSVRVRRYLKFLDLAGANEYARLDLAGGATSFIPRYTRVGSPSAYPGFYGSDASTIAINEGTGVSNPRDLYLRALHPASVAASVSGAVSLDLSSGTVRLLTLTGNVTSFGFSNPTLGSLIEVHFIQDATGSRTLAGINASLQFAGATPPTLTTTAGRRDIFVFRVVSGTYYEVGRSTNVG